jgi:hypothetical protein
MGKPGPGIIKTVKKYAETLEIRGNAQDDGSYNDEGDFVRGSRDPEFIQLHYQPMSGKEAQNLPENLRTKEVLNYWTIEKTKIDVKKQIIIDDKIYTIETMKPYSSHVEGILARSGRSNHRVI